MSATKKTIVDRIMEVLGLDDSGKIGKFYTREIKAIEADIKGIENNKKVLKMNYDLNLDSLKANEEDAVDKLEDAKLAVTPEDVRDNASMTSFSNTYWANIKARQNELKSIKDQKAALTETYEDDIKENDLRIASRKEKLNICNS